MRETIELALRLEPDTKTIAVVSGDDYWLTVAQSELFHYRDRVREIDLSAPPRRELLGQVAALPPHTVVLYDLPLPVSGQPPLAGPDLIDAVAQRVREFRVSLKGLSSEVELKVHDSGCGFDPEKAIRGQGLGLTSMKERLKLVDGWLFVNSKPGLGTTIHACVPVRWEGASRQAAV